MRLGAVLEGTDEAWHCVIGYGRGLSPYCELWTGFGTTPDAMHRLTVGTDAGRFSGQPAVGATLVAVAVLAAAVQGQVPRTLAAGGRRAAR